MEHREPSDARVEDADGPGRVHARIVGSFGSRGAADTIRRRAGRRGASGQGVVPRQPRGARPRARARARPLARLARSARPRRDRARPGRDRARRARESRPDRRAPVAGARAQHARRARRSGHPGARHLPRRAAARVGARRAGAAPAAARDRLVAGHDGGRGGRRSGAGGAAADASAPSSGTTTPSTCRRGQPCSRDPSARRTRPCGWRRPRGRCSSTSRSVPTRSDGGRSRAAHELDAKGFSREQILADTAREADAYVRLARDVGHRFLAVAESHAAVRAA